MLLPTGASSFTEAMKMGSECYHVLKKVIAKKFGKDGKLQSCKGDTPTDISLQRR